MKNWNVYRQQPSGEAYAIYEPDNGRVITEIVGPLAATEHAAAHRGECAGNGSADDLAWASEQEWRECQCEDCTTARAASN